MVNWHAWCLQEGAHRCKTQLFKANWIQWSIQKIWFPWQYDTLQGPKQTMCSIHTLSCSIHDFAINLFISFKTFPIGLPHHRWMWRFNQQAKNYQPSTIESCPSQSSWANSNDASRMEYPKEYPKSAPWIHLKTSRFAVWSCPPAKNRSPTSRVKGTACRTSWSNSGDNWNDFVDLFLLLLVLIVVVVFHLPTIGRVCLTLIWRIWDGVFFQNSSNPVDGRNPAPTGILKTLQNNGIIIILGGAGFLSINSM